MKARNVSQIVFEITRRFPERPAIWARGKTVTYREFGERAQALATLLRRSGVQRGDRVAILSHRTDTVYVGILGILFAGATYVALNPRFPTARNQMILKESGAKALVIDDRCAKAVGELLEETPDLSVLVTPESDMPLAPAGKAVFGKSALDIPVAQFTPDLDALGSDLAYIVFTSGSTGKPKGVQITHDNLLAYLDNIRQFAGETTPDDKVVQIVDVTFDVSVHDMFTAWTNGASMISIPENAALMSARFVQEHGITQWFSVPSTARLLEQNGLLEPGSLPSLRSSIFAGEPLVASVAEAWMKAAPHSPVYNIYGPTEGTISLCGKHVVPTEFAPHEVVSLGEAFPGNRMGLFEPQSDRPVASGAIGEICFTGNQVTQGYWRDPALNQVRFFTSDDGAHWYRTGDLGRYEPARGYIFAGRVDHQVKIRGFRVELGEIEGVIRAASGASQVAVIPWPLSSDGNAMGCVAFIPGSPDGGSEARVREACVSRLPDYMVPGRMIYLDELPLNANGKTDYNLLKAHPALGQA
ncbi:MAG: D-alanine--poly(phosphoribitol) ligase [Bosea sp.]|uniref:amino acid adenylation domain-containing protein n=1 Tax=Bosea sp. (in: a-proteobacteria) TaxID=1871050 RepID=UPI002388A16C|nr:D-alanine--poly(phosphoribitol) ligase [Bosea sp. (in: a-proteobacteria)]MCP4733279.1 D-alanine--poly(phosphoribitol) ligase [Bosea sp. (in: a-proteobacteria)]